MCTREKPPPELTENISVPSGNFLLLFRSRATTDTFPVAVDESVFSRISHKGKRTLCVLGFICFHLV